MRRLALLPPPVLAAVLAAVLLIASCAPRKPAYTKATVSDGKIRISLSLISGGEPYFMTLIHGTKKIDFFVLMTREGPQSYFDACVKCYPKKMGYTRSDGELLCRACGVKYPPDGLKGIGGCYPVPLEGIIEAGHYVIDEEKIITGEKYF